MYSIDALSEPVSVCDAVCRQKMAAMQRVSAGWAYAYLVLLIVAVALIVWAVLLKQKADRFELQAL